MSHLIHGDNLERKIRTEKELENKKLLDEIMAKYREWKKNKEK